MITVEAAGQETSLNSQARLLKVSQNNKSNKQVCIALLPLNAVPFHSQHAFLSQDGKKVLPIIPGISTTPGQMVYAGSIGTQIANELLDFNRCGLTTQHVHLHFMLGLGS